MLLMMCSIYCFELKLVGGASVDQQFSIEISTRGGTRFPGDWLNFSGLYQTTNNNAKTCYNNYGKVTGSYYDHLSTTTMRLLFLCASGSPLRLMTDRQNKAWSSSASASRALGEQGLSKAQNPYVKRKKIASRERKRSSSMYLGMHIFASSIRRRRLSFTLYLKVCK
jgi:hypothetical protein